MTLLIRLDESHDEIFLERNDIHQGWINDIDQFIAGFMWVGEEKGSGSSTPSSSPVPMTKKSETRRDNDTPRADAGTSLDKN